MLAKVLLATLLCACSYDTSFEDCTVRCSADDECPGDLTCDGTACRVPGATAGSCAAIPVVPPSCEALALTCGPNGDEDCCSTSEQIPGGSLFRSYDIAADGMFASTANPASVSPFLLDRFEVTVGRFRRFVEAGLGTQQAPPIPGVGARHLNGVNAQGGWSENWNAMLPSDTSGLVAALKCDPSKQTWTDTPTANEELPINCLSWYLAFSFCVWDGGFLPTEAEWNFAAAGGSEQRAFPWSSPAGSTNIDCSYANYEGCGAVPRSVGATSPRGDGRWKQADLGGNLWEWALDWYATDYISPCDDCANLTPSAYRIVRGGDFVGTASSIRGARRNNYFPNVGTVIIGARCARRR